MPPPNAPPPHDDRHWRARLRVTGGLLVVWFTVTFVVAYFARALQFHVLGSPFGFWVAAQGGPLVFVAILWAHAGAMRRIDRHAAGPGAADPGAQAPVVPSPTNVV